jgi:hypothetical protein
VTAVSFRRIGEEVYPTTPCCSAIATACEDGTVCRACYEVVDDLFGMVWTIAEWQAENPGLETPKESF